MQRRAALRGLAGFLATGKGAVEEVFAKRAAAVQTYGSPPIGGQYATEVGGQDGFNPAFQVFRAAERKMQRRSNRRVAGLDVDLAALGAASPVWRAYRQRERDAVQGSVLERLAKVAGIRGWEAW